jgi:methyl-accepting chemotaxis protein
MKLKSELSRSFGFLSGLGSGASRRKDMETHAANLPILSRQLRDISAELTRETGSVCVEFQGIAGNAKQVVGFLSGLVGRADNSRNANQLVEDCQATMRTLLDRIDQSNTLFSEAIAQIKTVDSAVDQVSAALKGVDQSSFTSKLVALNAKIEAVHLGSQGHTFGIVAEQISLQAAKSSEMAKRGNDILHNMTRTMHAATTRLSNLASAEKDHTQTSRTAVERALSDLGTAGADMQTAMDKASEITGKLVADMGRAVLRLQFQDRVTQRLEHVIHSLDLMAEAVGAGSSSQPGARQQTTELATSLLSSYTMDSERAVHNASVLEVGPEADSGGDVELF